MVYMWETHVCCLGCRFCMVFSEVPFLSELNPEYLKVVKCSEMSPRTCSLKDYNNWWCVISKTIFTSVQMPEHIYIYIYIYIYCCAKYSTVSVGIYNYFHTTYLCLLHGSVVGPINEFSLHYVTFLPTLIFLCKH